MREQNTKGDKHNERNKTKQIQGDNATNETTNTKEINMTQTRGEQNVKRDITNETNTNETNKHERRQLNKQ